MSNKIKTYCQVSFLEEFFNIIPEITLSEIILSDEKISPFEEMSSLIYSKSALSVDNQFKILELAKNGNPFFKKLVKLSMTGGSEIIDCSDFFDSLLKDLVVASSTPSNSIHIYSNLQAVLLHSKLGFCTITKNNWIDHINYLSQFISFKVDRKVKVNQFPGWAYLRKIELPINAAIIADNYILDKPENFNNNIFDIIQNLLPQKLEGIDFELTIITKKDLLNPKSRLSKINDFIRSLNKSYTVSLTICCTPLHKPHDRYILTNYYLLQSGHSLDYYNKDGYITKDTTVHIFGINADSNNIHSLLLKYFSDVTEMGKLNFDMFGHGKNRLLSVFN